MKEQEIKELLENYFHHDYIIDDIKFHPENKARGAYVSFTARLKEGHPKEAMFFCDNISIANIHWDKMSFEADVFFDRLNKLQAVLDYHSELGGNS